MYLFALFGACSVIWVGLAMLARLLLPQPTLAPGELAMLGLMAAAAYVLLRIAGAWLNRSFLRAVERFAAGETRTLVLGHAQGLALALFTVTLVPYFVFLLVLSLYGLGMFLVFGGWALATQGVAPPTVLRVLYVTGGMLITGIAAGLCREAWRRLRSEPRTRKNVVLVEPDEHQALWATMKKVAARVGTAPAERIVLVSEPTIAVRREGGALRKLFGGGERVLVLGLPATHGMTVDDLEAILAHEFGHFSLRVTRWRRTLRLVRFALDVSRPPTRKRAFADPNERPPIQWLRLCNPGFWMFAFFAALFLRMTRGFTQAREVMADIEAVRLYGSAFGHALQRLAVNEYLFTEIMGKHMGKALLDYRVLTDCRAFMQRAYHDTNLKEAQQKLLAPDPEADSAATHPPLRIRLHYAKRYAAKEATARQPVSHLFDNWSRINRHTARDINVAFLQTA